MIGVVAVLVGYGVVSTAWAWRLYRDLGRAQQQLYTAWADGKVIPPLDVPGPPPASKLEDEFPPVIVDWLGQWDEGMPRDKWAAKCRVLLRTHTDPMQVINILDQPNFG